ncbi:MAG: carboxypeptidase-like regulatory domain-containing protein [Planctomycetota bacterium]
MQALRITIAGLAVLTAVGAGFVLLRTPDARDPGSVLPEPSTAARDGSAGGAELAPGPDPAPRSMAAVDSATSFRVVSAEGIDLLAVQWRDDDGEWQPANGPAVPRDARAVRAAGHGATDVDPAADDVVLTADALLRLECPGLGAAVLDPLLDTQFGPPDPERAAAAYLGPHGDDALVLAIDTSRWSRAESIGEAHVRVSLRPGGALFVDWVARSQERRTERIALDPSWLDAPAQSLRIVEAPGPPATGDVRRRVEVRLLGDADARQVHRSNRLLVSMHQRLRRWTSTDSHEPTVEIPGVPTGDEVLVRWRRGDGWYGRLRHTHDGGEATIQLRPPTRILGRVVDESGAGIAGVEPSIRFPRDGVRPRLSSAWNANRATETDESGAFELVLPHEVPFGSPEDALPEAIPTDGVLRVREPGHATLQRDVALAPGGVVDLGDLVLVSTAPHLVVRHGEALPETIYDVGWMVDGVVRWFAVDETRVLSPDTTALVLSAPNLADREPPAAVLLVGDGAIVGATRDGDEYEAAPSAPLDARIDVTGLAPAPAFLRVSIRWSGVDAQVHGAFRDGRRAEHARVETRVPRDGTELFWVERDDTGQRTARTLGPLGGVEPTIRLSR